MIQETPVTTSSSTELKTNYPSLDRMIEKCEKYSSDPSYVYKSCSDIWLVVMQKLEDSENNEGRDKVKDPDFAKFRASKLKVIEIINKYEPDVTTQSFTHEFGSEKTGKKLTEYKVGEIVYPDVYDEDIDVVCGGGIHYFKTIKRAYTYKIPKDYTGFVVRYFDDGIKSREGFFLNGKLNGFWTYYSKRDETKTNEGYFKDGKRVGKWFNFHKNGKQSYSITYFDGRQTGTYVRYNESGGTIIEGELINGKRNGKWKIMHSAKRRGYFIEKDYSNGVLKSEKKITLD